MGFQDAIRTCLKEKYATFQGRAARSEFWYFMLFTLLVGIVLIGLGLLTGGTGAYNGRGISGLAWFFFGAYGLFYIAVLVPIIAVSVRRLHDRNMSGWWYLGMILASLIPLVGTVASIAFIVICALKGTDGENKYGHDPLKGPDNAEIFS